MTPSRNRLLLAYITLYVVWGSSYLFIKLAVESMAPLPMAGARYFLAGAILCAVAWRAADTRPTLAQWRAATVVGTALMGSNAAVAFAVRRIPSGTAALLVALTPCWIVLLDWAGDRSRRPPHAVLWGIGMGVTGIALLIGPGEVMGDRQIDPAGALAVVLGTLTWAWGSLYARRAPRVASAQLLSGMHMLSGGSALLVLTAITGGLADLDPAAITGRSWIGFWYLVLAASLAGFTAYMYLLTHATPARASTYAFVNPVVAVVLGAVFAGEPITLRIGLAALVIVGAVALIVMGPSRVSQAPRS